MNPLQTSAAVFVCLCSFIIFHHRTPLFIADPCILLLLRPTYSFLFFRRLSYISVGIGATNSMLYAEPPCLDSSKPNCSSSGDVLNMFIFFNAKKKRPSKPPTQRKMQMTPTTWAPSNLPSPP